MIPVSHKRSIICHLIRIRPWLTGCEPTQRNYATDAAFYSEIVLPQLPYQRRDLHVLSNCYSFQNDIHNGDRNCSNGRPGIFQLATASTAKQVVCLFSSIATSMLITRHLAIRRCATHRLHSCCLPSNPENPES